MDKIIEVLLKKAHFILRNYVEKIKNNEKIDENEMLLELEKYKNNLILKMGVLKSLEGKITPDELSGIEFEMETAGELSHGDKSKVDILEKLFFKNYQPSVQGSFLKGIIKEYLQKKSDSEIKSSEEIWQMASIYENNWRKYPPVVGGTLLKGYFKRLKEAGDKTRIYKYKENDDLLIFLRIDDLAPGKKYFGSFNALSPVKGGNMGEAMLSRVLSEEGKDADIQAVCVPQEDVFAWYINKHGFVANGIIMDYEGTGQAMARIERKRNLIVHYYSDYGEDDIITEQKNNFPNNKHNKEKYLILTYSLSEDKKEVDQSKKMNDKIQELTNQGYVITREIIKKKDEKNKNIYLCFESEVA